MKSSSGSRPWNVKLVLSGLAYHNRTSCLAAEHTETQTNKQWGIHSEWLWLEGTSSFIVVNPEEGEVWSGSYILYKKLSLFAYMGTNLLQYSFVNIMLLLCFRSCVDQDPEAIKMVAPKKSVSETTCDKLSKWRDNSTSPLCSFRSVQWIYILYIYNLVNQL